MTVLTAPRILIAGARQGVGKSLVTLGLVYELRRRGLSVSVCTTNSNLSLGLVYRRVSGRYVRFLDSRLLSASQILSALYQASIGADIVLIDGSGGVFDGLSAGMFDGADAELAALSRTPALLVMDAKGIGTSLGASFKGYQYYARGFDLGGAIASGVDDSTIDGVIEPRDRGFFEGVMRSLQLPALLGAIPDLSVVLPPLPDKVSEQLNLGALPRQFFAELGSIVQGAVDIDAVLRLAHSAPEVQVDPREVLDPGRKARIAISDDACFGLCFQDNLDLLRNGGAELIGFSPMADRKLPADLGGLYLTGAYLDEYGKDLSSNQYMLEAIREFAEAGGAIYAEGASAAYLCERYQLNGEFLPGVGLIPVPAESQIEELEYCDAAGIADSVLGMAGFIMRGIHTGRWRVAREAGVLKSIQVSRIRRRIVPEGYTPRPNLFISFCLWHWGSCPETADYFLEAAREA